MSIVRAIGMVLALGLLAGSARGQAGITLTPADDQDPAARPYRTAALHGGPTFVHPVTVTPGRPLTLKLSLPAIRLQQAYEVAFLAGPGEDAEVIGLDEATIVWPEELVNPAAFMDSAAYRTYDGFLPSWSRRTRLDALLAGVVFCVLIVGAVFVRPHRLQVAVVLLLVIAAAAATGAWLYRRPIVIVHRSQDGEFLILATRRTVKWSHSARMAPVYDAVNEAQLVNILRAGENSMVVRTDGVTLTLHPQQIVLLRRQPQGP